MYIIKTENFVLELTPFAGGTVDIKVSSNDFAAVAYFDTNDIFLSGFATQLNTMYEKLEGSAKIQDLYETEGYIEFIAQKRGHIIVRGQLISRRHKNTQQLIFENEIEQTYLQAFVKGLFADYNRYLEE